MLDPFETKRKTNASCHFMSQMPRLILLVDKNRGDIFFCDNGVFCSCCFFSCMYCVGGGDGGKDGVTFKYKVA